jgi:DNA adenine methylase
MYQTTLFGYDHLAQVVNVASVPQRSPFRYPGGKTWLVPRIRRWLAVDVRRSLGLQPPKVTEFIEPFVGGGIVSLTVASERLASHVTMVELDDDVAAVWETILDPEGGEWLACRILGFRLAQDTVEAVLAQLPKTREERAFRTVVKNRVCHGGIMAPGSGLIRYGEGGRGISSRWYPETLARRIRHITSIRDRISFIHGDGLEVMSANLARTDLAFFIDPPYTVAGHGKRAGRRLYTHCDLAHERLFDLAAKVQGDFLMTYDLTAEVEALASCHGFDHRLVPMKNTHHAKMSELLIGPSLAWVQQPSEISEITGNIE